MYAHRIPANAQRIPVCVHKIPVRSVIALSAVDKSSIKSEYLVNILLASCVYRAVKYS